MTTQKETVTFNANPRELIRLILRIVYTENINQYNSSDEDLTLLKWTTGEFITNDGILTDQFIDKICSELADKDGTVKIENTDSFKRKLWTAFANSEEYIDFLNKRSILENGVFDARTNKEYPAKFGEHFITILSILEAENIDKKDYDSYIEKNLVIRGSKTSSLDSNEKDLEIIEKIKPINKKEMVIDYLKKHWIEITE